MLFKIFENLGGKRRLPINCCAVSVALSARGFDCIVSYLLILWAIVFLRFGTWYSAHDLRHNVRKHRVVGLNATIGESVSGRYGFFAVEDLDADASHAYDDVRQVLTWAGALSVESTPYESVRENRWLEYDEW